VKVIEKPRRPPPSLQIPGLFGFGSRNGQPRQRFARRNKVAAHSVELAVELAAGELTTSAFGVEVDLGAQQVELVAHGGAIGEELHVVHAGAVCFLEQPLGLVDVELLCAEQLVDVIEEVLDVLELLLVGLVDVAFGVHKAHPLVGREVQRGGPAQPELVVELPVEPARRGGVR
jgi:hypothetical protein